MMKVSEYMDDTTLKMRQLFHRKGNQYPSEID